MFFMNYELNKMVPQDHPLRTVKDRFPAQAIAEKREEWKKCLGREEIEDGVMRLTRRKDFDKERNKAISKKRAPWEHVFSKMSRRARYMGVKKTYLQALMEAIVHNLKRIVLLEGLTPAVIGTA